MSGKRMIFGLLVVALVAQSLCVSGAANVATSAATSAATSEVSSVATSEVSSVATSEVSSVAPSVSDSTGKLQLVFSHAGGWYNTGFDLVLATNNSNAKIYYTLDGSTPDNNSNYMTQRYTDNNRIKVYDATKDANVFSAMDLTWYKAHPYEPAVGLQPKCITVRAYAVCGDLRTDVLTENYFVDAEGVQKYGVKVISLTGAPDDFYRDGKENAGLMREEWRRASDEAFGHVQIFDESGNEIINQDVKMKLHGSYSKMFNQKSFRLHADVNYDATHNKLKYPFFDGLTDVNGGVIDSFKRVIVRNGGNDCTGTMLRDALNGRLSKELGFGVQAYEPAVVYHCGEFYGVCNIRERLDDHYISDHFCVDRSDVILVAATDNFELNVGTQGVDDVEWKNLCTFVNTKDMKDSANYTEFAEKVDVDDYVKYLVSELYMANTDWVVNNVRAWKSKGLAVDASTPKTAANGINYNDGKWRFLMYDTDLSDGMFHPSGDYGDNPTGVNFDSLKYAERFQLGTTELNMFRLLENDDFRAKFAQQYVDVINTTFKPGTVNYAVDDMATAIEKAMPYEINRFGYLSSMNMWNNNLQVIKDFFAGRPGAVLSQLSKRWELGDTHSLTISGIDANPSDYTVNGTALTSGSLDASGDSWTGEYFASNTVKLSCTPTDGRTFSAWEITDSTGSRKVEEQTLTLSASALAGDQTVRAILEGAIVTTPTPSEFVPARTPGFPEPNSSAGAAPGAPATVTPSTPAATSAPDTNPTSKPGDSSLDGIHTVKYGTKKVSLIDGGVFARPKDPSKKGCTFIAWYTNKSLSRRAKFPITVKKNITLYPRYGKNPAKIAIKRIKSVMQSAGSGAGASASNDRAVKILWPAQKSMFYLPVIAASKKAAKKVPKKVAKKVNGNGCKPLGKLKKGASSFTITAKQAEKLLGKSFKSGAKNQDIYFRIACYKIVSGVKCVSDYSAPKKVKL